MDQKKDDLINQCHISSLYHEQRECFLDFCHRVILFVIIMSSAFLASGLIDGDSDLGAALVLTPAVLASVDLVFRLSTASQTHKFFRHRFSYIEAKLLGEDVSPETLNEVSREIAHLLAEEPPAYRVLLYHCTNLADLQTTGKSSIEIPKYQMLFRNIFRFAQSTPKIISSQ